MAVFGSTENQESFQNFFKKNNTFKNPISKKKKEIYQLPGLFEKRLKQYYYSLYNYNKNEYLTFGRLINNFLFRVVYIIVLNLKDPEIITQIKSWVSLINSNTEDKISIILTFIIDSDVLKPEIDKTERIMHELITELTITYSDIYFGNYPVFISQTSEKQNILKFQENMKDFIDSNLIYLPKIIIDELNKLNKIIKKKELIQFIRNSLQIDAMDGLFILQSMESNEIIKPLNHEWFCIDIKFFHEFLYQFLSKLILNKKKVNNGSNCIFSIDTLQIDNLPNEFNNVLNFKEILIDFLVEKRIFFKLNENEIFFPSYTSTNIVNFEKHRQFYDFSNFLSLKYTIGRKIEFCSLQNSSLSSFIWFYIQSKFYEILSLSNLYKNDWDCFLSLTIIRYYYKNKKFAFRIFYDFHSLFEIHVIGENIHGCVILFHSIVSILHSIFIRFGFDKYFHSYFILYPSEILKWQKPKENFSQNNNNFRSSMAISNFLNSFQSDSCLSLSHDISTHLILPDILQISPSNTKIQITIEKEENNFDIIIEISVFDIFGNKRFISDDFQVLLYDISSLDNNNIIRCKKHKVPMDYDVVYSYELKSCTNIALLNYYLIITLPHTPVLIGNTPMPISSSINEKDNEKNLKLLLSDEEWKKYWFPLYDLEFLQFSNDIFLSNYFKFRDLEIKQFCGGESKLLSNSPLHNNTDGNYQYSSFSVDKISDYEYLQICVDASYLSEFSYVCEPKEFVSRHKIQRALNKYDFKYIPGNFLTFLSSNIKF